MFGYIYLTTNLINNKIYIGQHKSEAFDTKYKGSGNLLKLAIEKYGWDNFSCSILECCDSAEEMNEKEIYYISKYQSTNHDVGYNLSDGGFVPRLSGENNPNYGKHRPHTEEEKAHLSVVTKGHKPTFTRKRTPEEVEDIRQRMLSFRHTEEEKEKVRKHNIGSKMVNKDGVQKWVYADDIECMLKEGWKFGSCKKRNRDYSTFHPTHMKNRKPSNYGKKAMTNGIKIIYVDKSEIDSYIEKGFRLGMK